MSILTCGVQWFCTEQPRSSFSRVPCLLSWPLPPVLCPHSKQLTMGHPLLCVCIHTWSCSSATPPLSSHWLAGCD
ncbi:unnamed protein product [Staurois parvus]|uniref:Uncharacterized protein n=1 Tax=Staurois parvus TaxID=386267 RepID=A0ABN9DUN4_9NEOB|nr:unnamed protein product [Staurois parvus]